MISEVPVSEGLVLTDSPDRGQSWEHRTGSRRRQLDCWKLCTEYDFGCQFGERSRIRVDTEDVFVFAAQCISKHCVQ